MAIKVAVSKYVELAIAGNALRSNGAVTGCRILIRLAGALGRGKPGQAIELVKIRPDCALLLGPNMLYTYLSHGRCDGVRLKRRCRTSLGWGCLASQYGTRGRRPVDSRRRRGHGNRLAQLAGQLARVARPGACPEHRAMGGRGRRGCFRIVPFGQFWFPLVPGGSLRWRKRPVPPGPAGSIWFRSVPQAAPDAAGSAVLSCYDTAVKAW